MNDGDLDDLFRDAAAQYAPADRKEELWDRLVRKMDAGESGKRKPPFWKYGALLALLIAGVAVWQYEAHRNPGSRIAASSSPETLVRKPSHPAGTLPAPTTRKPETGAARTLPASPSPAQPAATVATAASPVAASGHPTSPASAQQQPDDESAAEAPPAAGVTGADAGASDALPALPSLASLSVTGRESAKDVQNGTRAFSPHRAPLSYPAASYAQTPAPSPAKVKRAPKAAPPFHHWNLGLSLGPDWSSAAAHGWRTGIGGGLTLTYRLNPHWGLSTGVLIDKKLYDARPADYHPSNPIPPTLDVHSIAASCTVIDVPVNVSYSLWQQGSQRIFLSAGLSSFFMQEEKYSYDYKTANGNWEKWSKEMYGKNQHIFSIVNIAPAYEKAGAHLSFQMQPYLKVPLQGIGYGKVKLLSTGVHLTISYGLH